MNELNEEMDMNTANPEQYGYYQPIGDNKPLYGHCTLIIRIENHAEYLKWQKYNGGSSRKWEYMVSYPAFMRATYDFHTVADIEIIARKIVQLLEMGFSVRATDWRVAEEKSLLDVPTISEWKNRS